MPKNFEFTVYLAGTGNTPEEAWGNAVEGFIMDPGICPEEDSIEILEDMGDDDGADDSGADDNTLDLSKAPNLELA